MTAGVVLAEKALVLAFMRTLSSAIQALIQQDAQHVCHLLTFTVGATTYRFAEDLITHVGNVYQPHLALVSGPKYSEQL